MRIFTWIAAMLLAAGCATAQVFVTGDSILYGPGLTNNLIPQNIGANGDVPINDGLGHIYWGAGGGSTNGGEATNVFFASTPSIAHTVIGGTTNTFDLTAAISNAWKQAADNAYAQATGAVSIAPGNGLITVQTNAGAKFTISGVPINTLSNDLNAATHNITNAGLVQATRFSGSGSNLTDLPVTQVVGIDGYVKTNFPVALSSPSTALTNTSEYLAHVAEVNKGVYDVKYWWGAKGDGQYLYAQNQLIAAGSRTLTVTNAAFTTNDIGKVIMIYGAGDTAVWGFTNIVPVRSGQIITNIVHGTNYHALTSFITNVVSGTQVEISNAAITTVNGTTNVQQGNILYGTDDTTNLQTAYRWIVGNGGGTAWHPTGVYIVNGPIQDPGNYYNQSYGTNVLAANRNHASQIYLQDLYVANHIAVPLRLEGVRVDQNSLNFNQPDKYKATAGGSVIASTLIAPTNGAVFSCENFTTYTFAGGQPSAYVYFNPVTVAIENMIWRCPPDPRQTAIDLRGAVNYSVRGLYIDQGFHIDNANYTLWPTYSQSVGLQLPEANDEGEAYKGCNVTVFGYYTGVTPGEHGQFDGIFVANAQRGVWFTGGGHSVVINLLDTELCRTNIAGLSLQSIYVNSSGEADETNSPSYPSVMIHDPANALSGNFFYRRSRNTFTNILVASPLVPTLNIVNYPSSSVPAGGPIVETQPNFSRGFLQNADDLYGTNGSAYNLELKSVAGDARHGGYLGFTQGPSHAGMSYGWNFYLYPNGDTAIGNSILFGGYQGGETNLQFNFGATADYITITNALRLHGLTYGLKLGDLMDANTQVLTNVGKVYAGVTPFNVYDVNGKIRYAFSSTGTTFYGTNNNPRINLLAEGESQFLDNSNHVQLGLTTNGAYGNGTGFTNLLHSSTVSAGTNVTVILTQNPDGSTNYQVSSTGGTNVINGGGGDTNWMTVYVGTNTYPIYGSEMFYSVTNHTGLTNNAAAAFGQDASYTNIGVEFVASNTITVIGLGAWIVSGNANDHIVSIYSGNTANPANLLGSVTITAGSLSSSSTYSNHYNYGLLASPVYVPSGAAYCILETTGGTDNYYTNSDVVSRTVSINNALLASSSAGYAYGSQISAGPVNALISSGLIPGQALVDDSVESNKLAKTSRQLITNSIVENTQDPGVWAKTGTNIMGMTEGTNAHVIEIGSGLVLTPNSATSGVVSVNITNLPVVGFTNLIAPQGKRLRGVNLVFRPENGDWYAWYTNSNFQSYITNDIALAKAAGFTAIRTMTESKNIDDGAMTIQQAVDGIGFIIRCAATNGLYCYIDTGTANRYASVPTGATLTLHSNIVRSLAAVCATNANVLAIDLVQEVNGWMTDTEANFTNYLSSMRAASKAVAPNIPVTASYYMASTSEATNINHSWIQPYVDFNDFHIYYQFRHADLHDLIVASQKPIIIGEAGTTDSDSEATKNARWNVIREAASHPQVEGAFVWALRDQSYTNNNAYGIYDTNSVMKTNAWVSQARTLPVARNIPMPVSWSVVDTGTAINFDVVPSEQQIFFNFSFPVHVLANYCADLDYTGTTTARVQCGEGGQGVDLNSDLGHIDQPGVNGDRKTVSRTGQGDFLPGGSTIFMSYYQVSGSGVRAWPGRNTEMILQFTPQQ